MSYGCKCQCDNFREHALGVSFAPSAMPTRSPKAAQVSTTEAQWEKDMPAYKRLRQEGFQPKDIDGCAAIEKRATDPMEITDGKIYNSTELSVLKDVKAEMAANGAT